MGKKTGGKKKKKIWMKIVATTSLLAVNRPNADRWNVARSRQFCGHQKLKLFMTTMTIADEYPPPSNAEEK